MHPPASRFNLCEIISQAPRGSQDLVRLYVTTINTTNILPDISSTLENILISHGSLPSLFLHSNVRLMLIRERESLLFQDPPGPLVYNVNMVCRASHQSLLIFNVHYISLVNVRPRVGLPSRLSVSFILSSLHIKIGSTNPVFSTPTPLFMVNFK